MIRYKKSINTVRLLLTAMVVVFCTTTAAFSAKAKDKNTESDSATVASPEETQIARLARLIPSDVLRARTGDSETDNVFSNYSIKQIQVMLEQYSKKLENTKKMKSDLARTSLKVGDRFLDVFPDSKVLDEIVIRHADLLFEKSLEEYDEKYLAFANASLDYSAELDRYDRGEIKEKPVPPLEPDYGFEKVVELYDLIINNMPESPYLVDALYGKAFIYGEHVPNKKEEAISILRELTRKYPDSRYVIDAYMLTAEYLFGAPSKDQPRKTIEAIPYYKKALDLIASKGLKSKYYDQALYKLGWAYFRIGAINPENYQESIAYFTLLTDDITKAEELFANKALPDYVDPRVKDEAMEYIAASFLSIQKQEDESKSGVERLAKYFNRLQPERRYEPIVYEKYGEAYESLLDEPKKIIDVYKALLNRFPDYERAPIVAQKIITQLDNATLEEGRTDREQIEQQLYDERKRLFYNYGRNSEWFARLRSRIEAQNRGDTLSYAEKSIATVSYDPRILIEVDRVSKKALFENIVYGVTRAQLLDGSIEPPLGIVVQKDEKKSRELYEQSVKDVDNYVQFFSRYDSTAYYALFQKSFILDTKLNRKQEALVGYLDISKNFAWDYYRKPAVVNAYVIATEVCQTNKLAQFTPGIDTIARFKGQPDSLNPDEKKYLEVLETLVRLFPHDSLAVPSLQVMSTIYLAKGYTDKYKEVNARLLQYYPIQPVDPGVLVSMSDYALYEEKDYVKSEQLAKAVFYGPPTKDKKDAKRREFAYNRIGESITQQAEFYKNKGNNYAAAQQYQRAALTVPKWKNANQAAVLASDNYVLAGRTDDAVRVNNYLIEKSSDNPEYKVKAYKGIVLAYEKAERYDSLANSLEKIADVFKDSTELAEESLRKSIKASMRSENWSNAIRVTDKYLSRYPDSKEAPDIAFNKIDLNLKMGNESGVFDSYGQFADKYVDKPLSVKAYFRRGEYLEKKNDIPGAEAEYEKAITRSEKLKGQADVWASESYYKLITYLVDEYKATPVKLVIAPSAYEAPKESQALKASTRQKTTKSTKKTKTTKQAKAKEPEKKKEISYDNAKKLQLKQKIGDYSVKLINLGGYRVIDAYYTPGFLSEDLADDYSGLTDTLYNAANEKGQKIKGTKRDINVAQSNADASQGYKIAGDDYATAYKNLTKAKDDVLAEQKGVSSLDTTTVTAGPMSAGPTDTSLVALNKYIDSLLTTTGNVPNKLKVTALNGTIEKTRSKISEMYYKAAKVKENSVYVWLNSQVPDEDKNKQIKSIKKIKLKNPLFIGDITELLTLSKIASTYVQPSVVDAIRTYQAGVEKSKALELDNEYLKLSNDAIIRLAPKAAERIDSLARVSGVLFDKLDQEYRDKLASIATFKTDDQIDLTLKIEKMKLVISNYNNLATEAVNEYYNAYQMLKEVGAPETRLNALADTATKFVFELGDRSMTRSENFAKYSKDFEKTFNEDFNKYWYSDAQGPYDDLGKLWRTAAQNVLGQVIDFVDEFGFQSDNTQKALRRLVNSDPRKFSIGEESKKVDSYATNSDWKVAKDISDAEWYAKKYDDGGWKDAVVNEGGTSLGYITKQVQADSIVLGKQSISVSPIWFRAKSIYRAPAPKPMQMLDSAKSLMPFNNNPKTGSPETPGVSPATPLNPETPVTPVVPDTVKTSWIFEKGQCGQLVSVIASEGAVVKLTVMEQNYAQTAKKKKAKTKKTTKKKVTPAPVLPDTTAQTMAQPVIDTAYKAIAAPVVPVEPDPQYVFFRKAFDYDGATDVAQLIISRDMPIDSLEIYVNGDRIEPAYNSVTDELLAQVGIDTKQELVLDISKFVIQGANLVAIKAPGTINTTGLKAMVNILYYAKLTDAQIKMLVKQIGSQRKEAREKLKQAEVEAADQPNP